MPSDPVSVGHNLCMKLLAARPRTEAQLREAMRRRGISEDSVEIVLHRLGAARLVDDAAFARRWVASRHTHRGLARRVLAAELRERGVVDDLIEEACEQLDDREEIATARALVERRRGKMRSLPAETQTRRLLAYLARRGYSMNVAQRVVHEAVGGGE